MRVHLALCIHNFGKPGPKTYEVEIFDFYKQGTKVGTTGVFEKEDDAWKKAVAICKEQNWLAFTAEVK